MVGQTLAHYKILEKIGSGSMGEVYLAEDTKLDRKVALKVLPPELAENEARRARFQREAKAIAALNHPNIVTVYSVEEAEDVHFITMELVKGKTLTELLPKTGFLLNRFFDIAIPLTDAVAAAHQEGITHRDLKPDNVMVSYDGRVKVLDFGLAKPVGRFAVESEGPTAAKTAEGVIVGTVSYMSPEQAEGKPVDHRTDIFSMGIILYEMLTGVRPFQGDTSTAVLSAILKDTPPALTEINPALPSLMERAIRRCLGKDPSRRYQSSLDIRNELEELKQDVQSGAIGPTRVEASGGSRPWWIAGVAALVLIAWLSGVFQDGEHQPDDAVPRLTNPIQVTSTIGVEEHPSWSPDARALAYDSDHAGNWDIWVSQIDRGQPLNRTADHEGDDLYPSWSPDGSRIAFFSARSGGGIFVMPVFAGPPRRVSQRSTLARNRPQWSPDGTELAYEVRESGQSFVEITSLTTAEPRRIKLPGIHSQRLDLSWSPGTRFFAYIDANLPSNRANQLMIVRALDGTAFAIAEAQTRELSPAWSRDERALYFASDRGGASDLWRQPLGEGARPEGDAQAVTVGLNVRNAAFSPDGARLAYSKGRRVANVWRVPILADRPATWADAEPMTSDQASVSFIDVSPDGRQLAFDSDRSGSPDIWILSIENRELRQLTEDPGLEAYPTWSPDGSELAFFSNRAGTRDVWVIPVDGGPARHVTQQDSEDTAPAWSSDGRSIAFESRRGSDMTIWAVSSDGGSPTRLVETPDVGTPHWSPDGEWLVFRTTGNRVPRGILLKQRSETEPKMLAAGHGVPRWSLDGQRVFFRRLDAESALTTHEHADLWAIDLEARTERQFTDLYGRAGRLTDALATDGTYLYFVWREDLGDIWVMDVVTDEDS